MRPPRVAPEPMCAHLVHHFSNVRSGCARAGLAGLAGPAEAAAVARAVARAVVLAMQVVGAAVVEVLAFVAAEQSRRMKKPACRQPPRRWQKRACVRKA